jgi:hypothetical protein
MINFSPLPSRVRRITKVYAHCIVSIRETEKDVYNVILKDGYESGSGFPFITFNIANMEDAIYQFKAVTRLPVRNISVALFSFQCQLSCGRTIQKGQNYIDLGGMKLCSYCGTKDQ